VAAASPYFQVLRFRLRHQWLEGKVEAGEIILTIALKKSLRSDRLYQPLYEANIMQLLLEGKLGAPQVDFEVHTLESAGKAARDTYRAA
jgi:Cfr10I/Bse634I restriction endonuclease